MFHAKQLIIAGSSVVAILMGTSAGVAAAGVAAGHSHSPLGHLFGRQASVLARALPRGPEHGLLMSSFARNFNPSHFNHAAGMSGSAAQATIHTAATSPTGHASRKAVAPAAASNHAKGSSGRQKH